MDVRILSVFMLQWKWLVCFTVTRGRRDEPRVDEQTCGQMRGLFVGKKCVCPDDHPTVTSNDSNTVVCSSFRELGCDISLGEKYNDFLLIGFSYFQKTVPILDEGCRRINDVSVWNLMSNTEVNNKTSIGEWLNVTSSTKDNFYLNQYSELSVFNFNQLWKGHMLMVQFSCNKCALLKVTGKVQLPFNVTLFGRGDRIKVLLRPSLKVQHAKRPHRPGETWGTSSIILIILTGFLFLSVISLICQFR